MKFHKVTLLIHYFTYSIVFLNARLAMFYTLLPFRFMSSSGFLIAGRQPVFDRPSLWPLVDSAVPVHVQSDLRVRVARRHTPRLGRADRGV